MKIKRLICVSLSYRDDLAVRSKVILKDEIDNNAAVKWLNATTIK